MKKVFERRRQAYGELEIRHLLSGQHFLSHESGYEDGRAASTGNDT